MDKKFPVIITDNPDYLAAGKLKDKVAIITGGDSGIGRAVAIAFAKEGADCVIVYYESNDDASDTVRAVEAYGRRCLAIRADIGDETQCQGVIADAMSMYGKLDILVNNAGTQKVHDDIRDITLVDLESVFRTNVWSMFYMTALALDYLGKNTTIINTSSVTAYRGSKELLDYSSTKGAIISYTRSLALQVIDRHIRVNAVAPGPVWTPLVLDSFDEERLRSFGSKQPIKRAAQPSEIAPAYVYLASEDSSYMTGQVLHVNGGEIINT